MGSSDSKDSKDTKKDDGNDDGCIGNRRVRTIIISGLIFAFFIFALAWISYLEDSYRDLADAVNSLCEAFGQDDCDNPLESVANAYAFVLTGAVISMVGCVCAVVLFFIPGCDDKPLGKAAGAVLILGGVIYMIGWIWYIAERRDAEDDDWDFKTDEAKERFNAERTLEFGEALLPGGAAILLGIDALFQIYDNEAFRLSSNLGLICTVAIMCMPSYYLQLCDEEEDLACENPDGAEAIATGYMVLFVAALVYIVLYIFTCCTCNCKDNCLVRVALAVALVVGGALTSIGYYAKSGGIEDANADDDPAGKATAYYIGYTILVLGLPVVWALDIALDDVKNRDTKK